MTTSGYPVVAGHYPLVAVALVAATRLSLYSGNQCCRYQDNGQNHGTCNDGSPSVLLDDSLVWADAIFVGVPLSTFHANPILLLVHEPGFKFLEDLLKVGLLAAPLLRYHASSPSLRSTPPVRARIPDTKLHRQTLLTRNRQVCLLVAGSPPTLLPGSPRPATSNTTKIRMYR